MTAENTPVELLDLLNAFIASDPRLDIWRRYPDITEAEDNATDTWACVQVSEQFAAFASARGWDAAVVHADDPELPMAFEHAWVRLTRDGAVHYIDWTARQFHNLFVADGHDPNVLTLPWPLAWAPHVVGDSSHLIVGPYATVSCLPVAPHQKEATMSAPLETSGPADETCPDRWNLRSGEEWQKLTGEEILLDTRDTLGCSTKLGFTVAAAREFMSQLAQHIENAEKR